jgi:hypothetical protein
MVSPFGKSPQESFKLIERGRLMVPRHHPMEDLVLRRKRVGGGPEERRPSARRGGGTGHRSCVPQGPRGFPTARFVNDLAIHTVPQCPRKTLDIRCFWGYG